jgi:hypothetical protein
MNYRYEIITPRDITLGIRRLDIEYSINNSNGNNNASGSIIGCYTGYTLTASTDPSQPNRTTYIFRTCIITNGQIVCGDNNINTAAINSVTLNFISSVGNTIVRITIYDNFSIAQNYCLVIKFIVIDNAITQDLDDIIVNNYVPEDVIDYAKRPTKLGSYDKNKLIHNYHNRVSSASVRYTNSISDVVSNCNFVPYLAVQDRYFVINYENDVTSEYANVELPNIRISGWTDRDIYFFEKVYADVSDPNVTITRQMGLLEPKVNNPYNSSQPFTLVHNMYPLSINRNGEIVVYNNQAKDFPYVTSLFHTANVSQIKYGNQIYKPLTPYMYYRTISEINKPTKVEILYSYLNRFSVAIATLQSLKSIRFLPTRGRLLPILDISTVTRNVLLPVDYNVLFYLESIFDYNYFGQTEIMRGGPNGNDDSRRIFVTNYNGDDIDYPVIIQSGSKWNCNLLLFQRSGSEAINLNVTTDLDVRIIGLGEPMSYFAGGGLLGWGRHNPGYESRYYLFSWYKVMRTKRKASNTQKADDYLRYYYYYQYII